MGQPADGVSGQVIAAAVGLLEAGGIARFELPYLAGRAGVDASVVEATWPDRNRLLLAAWTAALGWRPLVPDTGSAHQDLTEFGAALRRAVLTPAGRMIFRSSLPLDGATDLEDVRRQFWDTQFDAAAAIIRRAGQRGELRSTVEPLEYARMFCTAMHFDALYLDAPAAAGYVDSVTDVFLHGIAERSPGNTAEIRRDVRAVVGAGEYDVLGEDLPAPNYAQATSAQIRRAILDAAIRETTLRGPELLTRNVIARRVGVPIQVVERMWKSDADLLLDAGVRAREKTRPLPDSGTLWKDLLSFTDAKAQLIATVDARKSYLSAILRTSATRNAALVAEFWLTGLRESMQIFVRAQERGELRQGVDPDHATRMIVVSLYHDLFFADAPMRPDYAVLTLDVFLNGAAAFRSA